MDEMTYQSTVGIAESSILKYDHEYVGKFIAILNEHEHDLATGQTWQLKAEVTAFSVGTNDTTRNRDEKRLRPDKDFSEEELTYYSERAKTTSNVVMRQRYFDILWEKSGVNKREIGEGLIASSLELANLLEHDNQFEKIDSLNRALQIAVFLSKAQSRELTETSAAIRDYLKNLEKDGNLRPTLELTDTVINFPKVFIKSDYELCYALCEKAIKHYKDNDNNFTLRGGFVERLHKLKKLIAPNDYDPKAAAMDFAQTRIDEAAKRTDSIIVRQHFLIEAEKILKDVGLHSEARAIRIQVEALGKSDDFEKEFHRLEHTETIPKETIDHLRGLLKKYEDTCALIAISPNFYSSWKQAVESAENAEYTSITDMLVTPAVIDDNGMTTAVDTSTPERRAAMRYFQTSVEFKTFITAKLLRELIKDKSIQLKNFELQFSKIKHIDEDCHDSVIRGLELFLQEDYYSASLILTTQLENFIFKMLPSMNVEQYIFENDGRTQSFKTLTWMLTDIRELIGDDDYELLYYTLVDRLNLNIRTKVAHGKTTINSENLLNCYRIIQLFSCLLVHVDVAVTPSTITMTPEEEYTRDINQLKDTAISDLEELLAFSKELLASANFRNYVKAKTVIRYNTFSALYQRVDAILALIRANQGNVANIIVRSTWETLAEYDFINLETSNINLAIRFAAESKQQLGTWTDVKKLRSAYPNAETWQQTISDEAIDRTIARRRDELQKFKQTHPTINLDSYKSLLARLKKIDDFNLSKDPDYRTLTQFDYRSVYSLLSGDTHSTVLGNMHNTKLEPKVSLEIRLDAPHYETVRAAHVAYKFFLKFLQVFNRTQKLKKGAELAVFRAIDKTNDKQYKELQDKYDF